MSALQMKYVDVEGFKGIKDKVHIDFSPRSLTSIVGANGLGKSCLIEALSWCLQGIRGKSSQINNESSVACCSVQFQKGDESMVVSRQLRKTSDGKCISSYAIDGCPASRSVFVKQMSELVDCDVMATMRRSVVTQHEVAAGRTMLADAAGLADIIERATIGVELRNRSKEMDVLMGALSSSELLSSEAVDSAVDGTDELVGSAQQAVHALTLACKAARSSISAMQKRDLHASDSMKQLTEKAKSGETELLSLQTQHAAASEHLLAVRASAQEAKKAVLQSQRKQQKAEARIEALESDKDVKLIEMKRIEAKSSRAMKQHEQLTEKLAAIQKQAKEAQDNASSQSKAYHAAVETVDHLASQMESRGISTDSSLDDGPSPPMLQAAVSAYEAATEIRQVVVKVEAAVKAGDFGPSEAERILKGCQVPKSSAAVRSWQQVAESFGEAAAGRELDAIREVSDASIWDAFSHCAQRSIQGMQAAVRDAAMAEAGLPKEGLLRRMQARQQQYAAEAQRLASRRQETSKSVASATRRLQQMQPILQSAETSLQQKRSSISRLKAMLHKSSGDSDASVPGWYKRNVSFLQQHLSKDVHGLLTEQPCVLKRKDSAVAVNTVLGTRASRCVLVETREAASALLRSAQAARVGPFECIVVSDYRKGGTSGSDRPARGRSRGASRGTPLAEVIQSKTEAAKVVLQKFLSGWQLCNTIEDASSVRRATGQSCVTVNGEIVRASGELIGGKQAAIHVPLIREQIAVPAATDTIKMRKQLDTSMARLDSMEKSLSARQRECQAASDEVQRAVSEEQRLVAQESEATANELEVAREIGHLQHSNDRALRRKQDALKRFQGYFDAFTSGWRSFESKVHPGHDACQLLLQRLESSEKTASNGTSAATAKLLRSYRAAQGKAGELRDAVDASSRLAIELDARALQLSNRIERLTEARKKHEVDLSKLRQSIEGIVAQIAKIAESIGQLQDEVAAADEAAKQQRKECKKAADSLSALRSNIDQKQVSLKAIQSSMAQLRTETRAQWQDVSSGVLAVLEAVQSSGAGRCSGVQGSESKDAGSDRLNLSAVQGFSFPRDCKKCSTCISNWESRLSKLARWLTKARSAQSLEQQENDFGNLDAVGSDSDNSGQGSDSDSDSDEDEEEDVDGGAATVRRRLRGTRRRARKSRAADLSTDEEDNGASLFDDCNTGASEASSDKLEDCLCRCQHAVQQLGAVVASAHGPQQAEVKTALSKGTRLYSLTSERIASSFESSGAILTEAQLSQALDSQAAGSFAFSYASQEPTPGVLQDTMQRVKFGHAVSSTRQNLQTVQQSISASKQQCDALRRRGLMEVMQTVSDKLRTVFRTMTGGTGDAVLRYSSNVIDLLSGSLRIEARPDDAGWRPTGMLSGGQQAIVTIALFLGLHAASPTSFLILDEIDAALDTIKVVRLAKILRETALQSGTSVVVVSHRQEMWDQSTALFGLYAAPGGLKTAVKEFNNSKNLAMDGAAAGGAGAAPAAIDAGTASTSAGRVAAGTKQPRRVEWTIEDEDQDTSSDDEKRPEPRRPRTMGGSVSSSPQVESYGLPAMRGGSPGEAEQESTGTTSSAGPSTVSRRSRQQAARDSRPSRIAVDSESDSGSDFSDTDADSDEGDSD